MSSTTAGYLTPSTEIVPITEDSALDAILQAAIVGITGLSGNMVRPLWQQIAPTEPEIGTNWAAVGVISQLPEFNVSTMHHGTGAIGNTEETGALQGGWDEMQRHEMLEILVSFYGPNCRTNAHLLRDGLYVDQNREVLTVQGLGLIDMTDVKMVPELINEQWRKRADLRFRLYHLDKRAYPVRNLQEASGTVVSDNPTNTQTWDTDNITTEEN